MRVLILLLLLLPCFGYSQTVSSNDYLVRKTTPVSRTFALMADAAPIKEVKQFVDTKPGKPISQGSEGSCVGHSIINGLNCNILSPKYNLNHEDARALWIYARDHDSIKSNDGDNQAGTFVYDGLKRIFKLGYISKPELFGIQYEKQLRPYVAHTGPVIFSSLWLKSMDSPNPLTGEVTVDMNSDARGGHAYLLFKFRPSEVVRGVKLPARYYFFNSWLGYARFDNLPDGKQIFWISAAGVRKLLNWGGEAYPLPKIIDRD